MLIPAAIILVLFLLRELSFCWDIYALQPNPMSHNSPFDLSDKPLQKLVSELQPFILRVSGTGCENTQLNTGDANYVPYVFYFLFSLWRTYASLPCDSRMPISPVAYRPRCSRCSGQAVEVRTRSTPPSVTGI